MRLDAIVGYTFSADEYCPDCILGQLQQRLNRQLPRTVLDQLNTEAALDVIARDVPGFQVNRYEETSFDSDDFPKVIFACMTGDTDEDGRPLDMCGHCGKEL